MSARVHKSVHKVEIEGGRVIKTEIWPSDGSNGWVLVDGAQDVIVVEGFRANATGSLNHSTTWWKPNDAIRIHIRREDDRIDISVDRENGGKWWPVPVPTMMIQFLGGTHQSEENRKIEVSVRGGDIEGEISLGSVPLFPPAKPEK